MKSALAVLLLVLTLGVAAGANAAIITSTDGQGRRITFDVRSTAADTDWYASVLRATATTNAQNRWRISAQLRRIGVSGGL